MRFGAAAVSAVDAIANHTESPPSEGLHRLEAFSAIVKTVLLAAWISRLGSTGKPPSVPPVGLALRHVVVG